MLGWGDQRGQGVRKGREKTTGSVKSSGIVLVTSVNAKGIYLTKNLAKFEVIQCRLRIAKSTHKVRQAKYMDGRYLGGGKTA